MPAYFIAYIKNVKDTEAMAEYARRAGPTLADVDVKRLTSGTPRFEVLEGDPLQRVVVLEFPSMAAAKAWYNGPAYQEALKHRLAGSDCEVVLVEGP